MTLFAAGAHWRTGRAVVLAGALFHAGVVAAATPPAVSTAAVAAVPIIQITPHKPKPNPKDTKWGWKEWLIIAGSILTLGAVAAVEMTNHPSGSGTNSGMGMNNM